MNARVSSVIAAASLAAFLAPAALAGSYSAGVEVAFPVQERPRVAPKSNGRTPPPSCATVINFDNVGAPCAFASTTRLTNAYAAQGVTFQGPGGNDGGAILNECSNFAVTGHSAPNFLAFNTGATMADGGRPRGPERMLFSPQVNHVQINAGSGFVSGTVTLACFSATSVPLGSVSHAVESDIDTLTVAAAGIAYCDISFTSTLLIVDNLAFCADAGGDCDLTEVEAALTMIESKLDTDARWVDEAELAASQASQTTTITAPITAIEAKLDTDARWVDEGELAASQSAQTTSITTPLAAIESKLDTDARWVDEAELAASQSSQTTAVTAPITAIEAKLDTDARFVDDAELAATQAALTVEADQNEVKIDALEVKMDEHLLAGDDIELLVRVEIERALGEDENRNRGLAIFFLPESVGGHLEDVRDVVDDTITRATTAGCAENGARAEWDEGNVAYADGRWDDAFAHYARAYRSIQQGPCN